MDDEEELPEFATAFLRQLFLRNQDPRHLYLEEADVILPQTATRTTMPMLRAGSKLIKLGRSRGLGCSLITQRAASLNKNALTQTETLIAMRTTWPPDQDAILRWMKSHSGSAEVVDTLPGLADGEAFVFSPSWLSELSRIRFRRRRTYDSGATPEVGRSIRPPTDLASIDLAALRQAMAVTIEQAQADDPAVLRLRITELEQQLVEARAAVPEPVVERVEVPAMAPETVEQIQKLVRQLEDSAKTFREGLGVLETAETGRAPIRTLVSSIRIRREDLASPVRDSVGEQQQAHRQAVVESGPSSPDASELASNKLGRAERQLLTVLAQHGPRSHRQLALQSGYSPTTSTISVALGKLRKLGYVESGQPITATAAGVVALGELEPMPTGPALLDYWRSKLGKAERLILDAMLTRYPDEFRMPKLATAIGYSPTTSTISVALGKLRRLELVDGWKISDDFAKGIQ